MTTPFPMTVVAQWDDVIVFQTSAWAKTVLDDVDGNKNNGNKTNQFLLQKGAASYGELNLGLHVGDEASTVLHNRLRLLSAINNTLVSQQRLPIKRLPINSLHWVDQIHGKQIHDIDAVKLNMRAVAADAMVTEQRQKGLAIMTADCVPIVLFQPTSGKIAAIHAGWQGLACGVIAATVAEFKAAGKIVAWIGVCISQENYEVGSQVRDKLLAGVIENNALAAASVEDFNPLFSTASDKSDVKSNDGNADKVRLDLSKLAHAQLIAAGVQVNNEAPVDCSYANAHYYSYRRQTHLQQPATGRMALIIVRTSLNDDA